MALDRPVHARGMVRSYNLVFTYPCQPPHPDFHLPAIAGPHFCPFQRSHPQPRYETPRVHPFSQSCVQRNTRHMMALLNLADAPPVSHQLTRQASGDEMPLSTPGGSPGACGQFKTPRGIDPQTNEAMGSPVRERPSLHLSPFGLPEPNLSPHQMEATEGS